MVVPVVYDGGRRAPSRISSSRPSPSACPRKDKTRNRERKSLFLAGITELQDHHGLYTTKIRPTPKTPIRTTWHSLEPSLGTAHSVDWRAPCDDMTYSDDEDENYEPPPRRPYNYKTPLFHPTNEYSTQSRPNDTRRQRAEPPDAGCGQILPPCTLDAAALSVRQISPPRANSLLLSLVCFFVCRLSFDIPYPHHGA